MYFFYPIPYSIGPIIQWFMLGIPVSLLLQGKVILSYVYVIYVTFLQHNACISAAYAVVWCLSSVHHVHVQNGCRYVYSYYGIQ